MHAQQHDTRPASNNQKAQPFVLHKWWLEFRVMCLSLVVTPWFGLVNAAIIFINAIVLGLNW